MLLMHLNKSKGNVMSKMKSAINKLKESGNEVKAYIPGMGFRLCQVLSLDDDVVEIGLTNSSKRRKVKMHYSLFVVETG